MNFFEKVIRLPAGRLLLELEDKYGEYEKQADVFHDLVCVRLDHRPQEDLDLDEEAEVEVVRGKLKAAEQEVLRALRRYLEGVGAEMDAQ